MRTPINRDGISRIIDANVNRAKEGLRVCEEVARFILDNRSLTSRLKDIRHAINGATLGILGPKEIVRSRRSSTDIGKGIYANELKRGNYLDIFLANIQRSKESIRVLEEFAKLKDIKTARRLKDIRYRLYDIEKKAIAAICSITPKEHT